MSPDGLEEGLFPNMFRSAIEYRIQQILSRKSFAMDGGFVGQQSFFGLCWLLGQKIRFEPCDLSPTTRLLSPSWSQMSIRILSTVASSARVPEHHHQPPCVLWHKHVILSDSWDRIFYISGRLWTFAKVTLLGFLVAGVVRDRQLHQSAIWRDESFGRKLWNVQKVGNPDHQPSLFSYFLYPDRWTKRTEFTNLNINANLSRVFCVG